MPRAVAREEETMLHPFFSELTEDVNSCRTGRVMRLRRSPRKKVVAVDLEIEISLQVVPANVVS